MPNSPGPITEPARIPGKADWQSAEAVDPDRRCGAGIVINGEVSGAIGAQAEAEAEAGYKKGKLRAEAGAKLGLGAGLGAKVGGGLTGVDKAWGRIKDGWNALWGN